MNSWLRYVTTLTGLVVMHFGIRDVMVLVYRVILQEHVLLQGSCDLMDRSP